MSIMGLRADRVRVAAIGTMGVALAHLAACGGDLAGTTSEAADAAGSMNDAGAVIDSSSNVDAGAPDVSCPEGETPSTSGGCLLTIASNLYVPSFVAVDDTRVGWTSGGSGTGLLTAPKLGGTPTTLAVPNGDGPPNLALTDTNAYWAGDMGLETAPVAGGPVSSVTAGTGGLVAVDANNLYWADGFRQAVMRMPLSGGTPTTLAPHVASDLAVDSTSVYFETVIGLMKVPIQGGTVSTLARELLVGAIAVAPTGVYVLQGYALYRVPLDGGNVDTLVSEPPGNPEECGASCFDNPTQQPGTIATDDAYVYWTGGPDGHSVLKMPLAGGTPQTLASSPESAPAGIAVDATSVYWADQGAGTIVRLTPK